MKTLRYVLKIAGQNFGLIACSLIALVVLAGLTCGCSEDTPNPNGSAPTVSGIYDVISGSQRIIDSYGSDEFTDFEGMGLGATVSQDGQIIEFFNCMGLWLEDGTVTCDSDIYGIDQMFGPYYHRIQGKLTFSDNKLSAHVLLEANYPLADYSGTNDLKIEATFNQDYTETCKPSS